MPSVGQERATAAPRQHGLDVIRAAAIASVLLYHGKTMSLLPASAPWPVSFGWIGVDLFFVLSGFLIASQLLRPLAVGLRPDYRRFFTRRAFRTFPAFAVVLLAYFAVPAIRETPQIQPFWQFPTFTENLFFKTDAPKAFDQVWSLCVEEQFYLLFPLAVALMSLRPSAAKVYSLLVGILFFGIAVRSVSWAAHSAGSAWDWQSYVRLIYYPTWSRLDGLLAGIALAALKILRPEAWDSFARRPAMLLGYGLVGVVGAVFLFRANIPPLISIALGYPVLSAAIALIVAAASSGTTSVGRFRVPGAQALATGAYSIYLSHKIAFHVTTMWIAPALGASGYAAFVLALGAAFAVGALLYWGVERPFLRLRDTLHYRSRSLVGSEMSANAAVIPAA